MAPSNGSSFMHPDRDGMIRARINDLGSQSFPDDPDVVWLLRRIVHYDKYTFVEAEPNSARLGYARFMFVLSFTTAEPDVVGCYCLDNGLWRLLFTTPNTPSDWTGVFPAENLEGFEADLLPLLQEGKKIEAIKVYRETTGDGLREAKDAVEAIARRHGLAMSKAGCAGLLFCAVVLCLVTFFACATSAQSADNGPQAKKTIEWGWDEPDTKFIRENIAQMEQFPFDGLVFHVNSSKGGGLTNSS
jgi:hypothetical protein